MMESIKFIQQQLGVINDGIWGQKSHTALLKAIKAGKVIYISKHITVNDLLFSDTAIKLRVDNFPSIAEFKNLVELANVMLEQIIKMLGHNITITSGYRCRRVNLAVGSTDRSVHPVGWACDFRCPEFGDTGKIYAHLAKGFRALGIKFDQLIIENRGSPKSWIHIGLKNRAGLQRKRLMELKV